MALLTGVVLAVALAGANENRGDEKPLALAQADALCVAHHADPQSVLAAADLAGWSDPFAGKTATGGLLAQLDMNLSQHIRIKTLGADHLMLSVRERNETTKDGTLRSFVCTVLDEGAGSKNLGGVLRLRFQIAPSQSDGKHLLWVYRDKLGDGQPLSMAPDEQYRTVLAGHRIVAIATVQSEREPAVSYSETVLVPR